MSKAILILDEIPENCLECPIGRDASIPLNAFEGYALCLPADKLAIGKEAESRPDWCPLCEVPDRIINTNLCDTCKNSVAVREGKN